MYEEKLEGTKQSQNVRRKVRMYEGKLEGPIPKVVI